MSTRPPNVLFLMADDHRHDALGCAGDPVAVTPHLDGLAARGLRCTAAHIMGGHCGAVCIPSRACMNTGCTPFRASSGIDGGPSIGRVHPDRRLMGEHFQRAGYRSFHTGKWHLDRESLNRSFDSGSAMFLGGMHDHFATPQHAYDPTGAYDRPETPPHHSSTCFAEAAIGFIRETADGDRPWFLSCCFTAPHDPRTAPADWHRRFDPAAMPLPANAWREHPFDNGELAIRDEQLAAYPRDPDEVRRHLADYHAIIGHMDEEIGRILAALDASGMGEDTIVVYTGDHGLAVGQHALMGKQNCYDHSIRIPLIAAGPGLPDGETWDGLVYGFDLFPTLCDWCGLETPEDLDGRSFAARGAGRDHVYNVYRDKMACVAEPRWKLIRTWRNDEAGEDRLQLFDRIEDPLEIHDRCDDEGCRPQLERLAELMHADQVALGDPLGDRPVAL